MVADPSPEDIRRQSDLASAMQAIRVRAGMSLGEIAAKSAKLKSGKISKTTVSNITTPGASLPGRRSLRAFLNACKVDSELVDEWCAARDRIASDDPGLILARPPRVSGPLVHPDDEVWRTLVSLSLFDQVTRVGSQET